IIAEAGTRFLLELYGFSDVKSKKSMSLIDYRYTCFTKSSYKCKFNIAALPPTEAAGRQHLFRTYHQVQQWYGNEEDSEQWGWKRNKNGLIPVRTLEPPAPETLLKLISCKCKKGCQKQVPSHDSDEEEETETVFDQMYDGIENEEDRDESENPIADDAEENSACDVSIDTEDDEIATPSPSRTAKRRLR
ncbi:hypothetical protein AVEN_66741-2-1, partial [Araneus ventricosus]